MTESRDDRQLHVYGRDGLDLMRSLRVAVLGVGLVGGGVALHLGLLKVPLLLVDPGLVEPSNLGNQFFSPSQLGECKARVRAAQIQALSPGAPVDWVSARLEELGLGVWSGVDLLVTGLDSRGSRVRVAQISHLLDLPWIDMAVDGSGERLQGNVTCYEPSQPDAPCQACRYDEDDLAKIRIEGRGPGCPSWTRPGAPKAPPTYMASAFAAVVSGFAASRVIDILLGKGARLANTQLQIFADGTPRVRTVALHRSRKCPMPHERLGTLTRVPSGTIGELFDRAAADLNDVPSALHFHHRTFSPDLYCPTSDHVRPLPRLTEAYGERELACHCRYGARFVPQSPRSLLTLDDVERFRDRGWTEVGLPREDVITATTKHGREAHYIVG